MANDSIAILVNYVCPGLAVILSNGMWLTSLPLVLTLRYIMTTFDDIKGISTINPYPYLFMVLNCLSWTIYGYFLNDFFVFFSNVFGFLLGVFYTLTSLNTFYLLWKIGKIEEKEQEAREEEMKSNSQQGIELSNTTTTIVNADTQAVYQMGEAPMVQISVKPNEYYRTYQIVEIALLSILTFWFIIGMVSMIILHRGSSDSAVESTTNLIGLIALIFTISYYGSPLTMMATVIRQRDSSSLYFPMILVNFINATLWFFYGFFGLNILYIWLPNAIGASLAIVQFLLIYLYPAQQTEESQFFTLAEMKSLFTGQLPESRQNVQLNKSPLFDI